MRNFYDLIINTVFYVDIESIISIINSDCIQFKIPYLTYTLCLNVNLVLLQ